MLVKLNSPGLNHAANTAVSRNVALAKQHFLIILFNWKDGNRFSAGYEKKGKCFQPTSDFLLHRLKQSVGTLSSAHVSISWLDGQQVASVVTVIGARRQEEPRQRQTYSSDLLRTDEDTIKLLGHIRKVLHGGKNQEQHVVEHLSSC